MRLVEVADGREREVLRAYRRTFGFVPFVRRAFETVPAYRTVFLVEP